MPAKPNVDAGGLVETIEGIAQSTAPTGDLSARDNMPGLAHSRGNVQYLLCIATHRLLTRS